ncbi:DgyrCDS9397 [Dimorphilus gyrociliatus]|uniref:DgyrCDS9397 n=1 Tax=Dimorphilus gyrociliatus TaxID=2664684 RepID=A0A7I8VZJ4_9ANNE|nr:DgyrCDS9397 [Dimorphilus gyrociliatus]
MEGNNEKVNSTVNMSPFQLPDASYPNTPREFATFMNSGNDEIIAGRSISELGLHDENEIIKEDDTDVESTDKEWPEENHNDSDETKANSRRRSSFINRMPRFFRNIFPCLAGEDSKESKFDSESKNFKSTQQSNSTSKLYDDGESQLCPDLRQKVIFLPEDGNQSGTESVQSNFAKPSASGENVHDKSAAAEESFIWDTNEHNDQDTDLESEGESYKC